MLHLLWALIQGVLFLLDLISLLMNGRILVCLVVTTPIALMAFLTIADHEAGRVVALIIVLVGFAAGVVWDTAVDERQAKRKRRFR